MFEKLCCKLKTLKNFLMKLEKYVFQIAKPMESRGQPSMN